VELSFEADGSEMSLAEVKAFIAVDPGEAVAVGSR
jgi:hypothetical protein